MLEVELPAVNRSLDNENGELADQKPFVIRGHHLRQFSFLNNVSPVRLAEITRRVYEVWWIRARENPNDAKAQKTGEYVQDILGLSLEGADEFED